MAWFLTVTKHQVSYPRILYVGHDVAEQADWCQHSLNPETPACGQSLLGMLTWTRLDLCCCGPYRPAQRGSTVGTSLQNVVVTVSSHGQLYGGGHTYSACTVICGLTNTTVEPSAETTSIYWRDTFTMGVVQIQDSLCRLAIQTLLNRCRRSSIPGRIEVYSINEYVVFDEWVSLMMCLRNKRGFVASVTAVNTSEVYG